MGMTNASKFKKHYLDTLLEMGVITMTQPDSPNSPKQRYVLTEEGRKLLEYWIPNFFAIPFREG